MSSADLLTIGIVLLFIHSILALLFSKLIIDEEPRWGKRLALLVSVWLLPIIGAVLVSRALELNWFKNDDGSSRTGGVAFSFLESDAIFNPGSKQVLQEQQRTKMETRKQGKDLDQIDDAK